MLHLGSAWYPEHWPEERWPRDVQLMKEAGFTVARIAEFAWSTMEPEEGRYELDWLVRAADLLHQNGLAVVLGTPTAAPPAWLTAKYPETLLVRDDGRPAQHGNRCHYCVNSPVYHRKADAIVSAMAERLGSHPAVIGWQIDNEFGRACYCANCRAMFQDYLAQRHGDLATLNRRLSAAYWSQAYSDWRQIPLPVGSHNPGLMLEFRRFVSESFRRFQALQIKTLRPSLGGRFVTHNFFSLGNIIDHHALAADLDLASWDYYIGSGNHNRFDAAFAFDFTRGLKRRNFWLMETQPGHVNWAGINTTLDPGETRALAWQAAAHGADAVLYWQWRSAPGGQEQYHGTLLGADGEPRPLMREIARLGREFAAIGPALAGTSPRAQAAVLYAYDARWILEWQKHHQEFSYVKHLMRYHRHLSAALPAVDVISTLDGLRDYRLIVAPALIAMDEAVAEKLRAYVEAGGHLALTARTGQKDGHNALLPMRQPGPLADAAGVEVEEFYALAGEVPLVPGESADLAGTVSLWAETLQPRSEKTAVLARYGEAGAWLDGRAAITAHAAGGGMVYYIGAVLDDAAQEAMTRRMLRAAGLEPLPAAAAEIETAARYGPDGREVLFLINHNRHEAEHILPRPGRDALTGRVYAAGERLVLEPYGVAVLIGGKEGK